MSLTRMLGIPSMFIAFLEMIFFFCILTPAYLFGIPFLVLWGTQGLGSIPTESVWSVFAWVAAMPLWAILLLGLGYFLIVILYWIPGDKEYSNAELRGFALFLVTSLIVGGVYLELTYGGISRIIEPLRESLPW